MASNLRLIAAGLKHLVYKRLNRDMVGYKVECELTDIMVEEIREYARATNDLVENYNQDSIIPPLFVSRLIHPILMDTILNPKLRMNILKMVHGELDIRWYLPVYAKDRLGLRMEIKDIIDTSAGELIKISFIIFKDRSDAAEAIAGLLVRNPKGEKAKKEEGKGVDLIKSIKIQTREGQALEYARASLDNNLIHINHLFARIAGLKRPILHGVCAFAMTCNELLKNFAGNDKKRLSRMSGRFASPVYPGENLILNCYRGNSEKDILFEVINEYGKTNIKNGRFEFL